MKVHYLTKTNLFFLITTIFVIGGCGDDASQQEPNFSTQMSIVKASGSTSTQNVSTLSNTGGAYQSSPGGNSSQNIPQNVNQMKSVQIQNQDNHQYTLGYMPVICQTHYYYGIALKCFDGSSEWVIKKWLDFLNADPEKKYLAYVQKNIHTLTWEENDSTVKESFKRMPARAINLGPIQTGQPALVAVDTSALPLEGNVSSDWAAYYNVNGNMMRLPSSDMSSAQLAEGASLLIHEAAHTEVGGHTNGTYNDITVNGAWGIQFEYLKNLSLSKRHPKLQECSERESILLSASGILREFIRDRDIKEIMQIKQQFYSECPRTSNPLQRAQQNLPASLTTTTSQYNP